MFAAVGKNKQGVTSRVTKEITILSVVGLALIILGVIWFGATDGAKISIVPIALGFVGLGFAVFGLIAKSKTMKTWEEGETVAQVTETGVTFKNLPEIPWDNIVFANSVGEHSDKLTVGFGVAAAGKGKQATLHSPIAKVWKQPIKHKLGSTYLLLIVENMADNFGENFTLGTIKPVQGERKMHQVILSPDVFLDKNNYTQFIEAFSNHINKRNNIYAHYYFANASVIHLASWAQYRVAGVHPRGNTITEGTRNLNQWVQSLTEEQYFDILQRFQAKVSDTNFVTGREQILNHVNVELPKITGRDVYADKLYSSSWALTSLDRLLHLNPKTKITDYQGAVSVLEFASVPYLAEANGIPINTEMEKYFIEPLTQAGYTPVQSSNETVAPVSSAQETRKAFPSAPPFASPHVTQAIKPELTQPEQSSIPTPPTFSIPKLPERPKGL